MVKKYTCNNWIHPQLTKHLVQIKIEPNRRQFTAKRVCEAEVQYPY